MEMLLTVSKALNYNKESPLVLAGFPKRVDRINDRVNSHFATVQPESAAALCYFGWARVSGNQMPKRATSEARVPVTMADIFGPGGMLEKCHPGYEFRRAQLEMAEMVDAAFQRHQHALIEAGTGTGKTLAYLIPAIRSGRRVVISTATKSLQEQLFQKDIPFLRKYFAPDLKVALMKGRNNFV